MYFLHEYRKLNPFLSVDKPVSSNQKFLIDKLKLAHLEHNPKKYSPTELKVIRNALLARVPDPFITNKKTNGLKRNLGRLPLVRFFISKTQYIGQTKVYKKFKTLCVKTTNFSFLKRNTIFVLLMV